MQKSCSYLLLFNPIMFFCIRGIESSNLISTFSFFFLADINKGSPIDYKSGSACSTPTKDTLKSYERSNNCMGPVLPPRSVMGGIPSHHHHHYSAPMNFRKGFAARCSSRNVAIVSVALIVLISILLIILTGEFLTFLSFI